MAEVLGMKKLVAQLQARAAKAAKEKAVGMVGYTADYAAAVHEDLEAVHPVGQAKFLEEPARTNQAKYRDIITEALRQGKTMGQAILLACLALQRDSQELCPVDTGNMRAGAFSRLTEG